MPRRLGVLIPSSNTIVEPITARLHDNLAVTTHVARIGVRTISADAVSLSQFETAQFVAAAALLADARVDLILWNGTAASWFGFGWDADIVAAISGHTGIQATTAVMAVNEELSSLGARTIGLVTPYIAELEARIVANYASIGLSVVATERLDLTVNTDYAEVAPARIATMCRAVAAARPDAIVILCTNLAGAPIADELSLELGIPVIDSVQSAVRHSLRLLA